MDLSFLIPVAHAAESGEAAGGVVGTLGLNVTSFVGQLINFGIILFIMWKWVFPRVGAALMARTERIEKALKDADAVAKDKAEFEVWRGKQIAEARNESAAIITAAQKSAEKIGADIMEATRREQEELTGRAKQQIAEEQERAIQAAKQELAGLVVQATQKILGEKLDVQQDKALIKKSLEETIS